MNNKGTALIVTIVYIMIVAVICTSVLAFSAQHYKIISHRLAQSEGLYYGISALYIAINNGQAAGDNYELPGTNPPIKYNLKYDAKNNPIVTINYNNN